VLARFTSALAQKMVRLAAALRGAAAADGAARVSDFACAAAEALAALRAFGSGFESRSSPCVACAISTPAGSAAAGAAGAASRTRTVVTTETMPSTSPAKGCCQDGEPRALSVPRARHRREALEHVRDDGRVTRRWRRLEHGGQRHLRRRVRRSRQRELGRARRRDRAQGDLLAQALRRGLEGRRRQEARTRDRDLFRLGSFAAAHDHRMTRRRLETWPRHEPTTWRLDVAIGDRTRGRRVALG
jgi:hypothetical protein